MKLSDAIWLGDSMKKGDAQVWLTIDGSCGCALGGALLAAGVTGEQFTEQFYKHPKALANTNKTFAEIELVKNLWPWLTHEHVQSISYNYCRVRSRCMSIEELCDYVRSIEPTEPEYEPEEEYWSDADTTREMVNSIKGR